MDSHFSTLPFCTELVLYYVPGHVGLPGNEWADSIAKHAAETFDIPTQNRVSITLSNLKSFLKI